MSDLFLQRIDQLVGDADDINDIRVVVRRAYLFDFVDEPLRIWQGQGLLKTIDEDDNVHEWAGTVDASGGEHLRAPRLQDGRDGSSATYTFGLEGVPRALYEETKADQSRAVKRDIWVYLVLFHEHEGMLPSTPIMFLKKLTMFSPQFSEKIETDRDGQLMQKYNMSVSAKDSNFGRSNRPNRTYSQSSQQEYANQLGVSVDLGCSHVANLSDRTYEIR